jgi:hypothetical protein
MSTKRRSEDSTQVSFQDCHTSYRRSFLDCTSIHLTSSLDTNIWCAVVLSFVGTNMFNTNTLDQVEYVTTVVDAVRAQNQGTFHRQTIKTAKTITDLDVTRIDLRRPELTIFDDTNNAGHWNSQYAAAPWALKVKSSNISDLESHKEIIDQVADVVRLRMASRPLHLFTLSLMLCDSRFWVVTWDRDGVVVSRPHHLEEEQDLFRRMVISLHCYLDLHDLGLDRNVSIAADLSHVSSGPHPWELVNRSFLSVMANGHGNRMWRVRRASEATELVHHTIRWSWGSSGHEREPNIHANIEKALMGKPKTQPTTIALIDSGAAVNNLDDAKVDIQPLHSGLPIHNLFQTCIVLNRVGKSIWEYENDTEIMRGARDMLQGDDCVFAIVIIVGANVMTSSSRLSP